MRQNFERISWLLLAIIDKKEKSSKNKVVSMQMELRGEKEPRMYGAGE